MAQNDYNEAVAAAEKLVGRSEEELFRELGLRKEGTEKSPDGQELALSFDAEFPDVSEEQGWDFFVTAGRRWYVKAEAELMRFLCDKNNGDREKLTSGKSIPQIAASLATAGIVTAIAAPPAWLIVATTIVATKLTTTALDALCEVYYERNPQNKPADPH
jgi:hypothetical protein